MVELKGFSRFKRFFKDGGEDFGGIDSVGGELSNSNEFSGHD